MTFPLEKDRLEEVAALDLQCFRDPWDREEWARVLENPLVHLTGIDDGEGKLAAFCCYCGVLDEYEIWKICVRDDLRRRGLAKELLDSLIKEASSYSPARVFLEVRAGNVPAVKFYEKAGFTPLGRRNCYYRDGEDALVYVLEV